MEIFIGILMCVLIGILIKTLIEILMEILMGIWMGVLMGILMGILLDGNFDENFDVNLMGILMMDSLGWLYDSFDCLLFLLKYDLHCNLPNFRNVSNTSVKWGMTKRLALLPLLSTGPKLGLGYGYT